MDASDLPADQHELALNGLRRINEASKAAQSLARVIIPWAQLKGLRRLRLLDVACGSGDVPVTLARLAAEKGIDVELFLVDRSKTALQQAERIAGLRNVPVQTAIADATAGLPAEAFDVVTNSLFLHHLDERDVIAALTQMRKAAGRLLLISDLRRNASGFAFAWAGCRVLSRSPIVHFDGPVSVRGAWTISELHQLANAAALAGASIRKQWPFRMMLKWERFDG